MRRVLGWTTQHFEKQGVDAPRLTAELLLAHVLGSTGCGSTSTSTARSTKDELAAFRALIQRRLRGEPTQYLTGYQEFYGRPFAVDPRVLIPRPETELLVEAVLEASARRIAESRVLDLCTGSGCIALTLAAERPAGRGAELTDALAGRRARSRGPTPRALRSPAASECSQGDLFAPLPAGALRRDRRQPAVLPTREIASFRPRWSSTSRSLALDRRRGRARRCPPHRRRRCATGSCLAGSLHWRSVTRRATAVAAAPARGAGLRDVRVEKDLARLDRLAVGQGHGDLHMDDDRDHRRQAPLKGEVHVSGREERRAAASRRRAARARASTRSATCPTWPTSARCAGCSRTMGCDAPSATARTLHVRSRAGGRDARGAVRAGEDDARVGAGARAAGRALRPRARLAARRLRHRRAAHRPAPQGPGGAGREDRARRTATSRPRAKRLRGAHDRLRPAHRHRHRELMMAAALAEGRDRAGELPRASPRSRSSPGCSTRWARGSRAPARDVITIEGVDELQPIDHAIIPDRIEAGTLLVAAAITGGDVLVQRRACPSTSTRCIAKLREAGCDDHRRGGRAARARRPSASQAVDIITAPHPGLPHRHAGAVHGAA